jgi:hypothetical protein
VNNSDTDVMTGAHIDALLDDPMIKLIMTVDRIDREEAGHLFRRVANRIAFSALPHAGWNDAKPED